jgi:hypothetical protein
MRQMPDIGALKSVVRPLAVDCGDGIIVNIQYRPNVLTTELVRRLVKLTDPEAEDAYGILGEFISEWDLTEHGVPIAFDDVAAISRIPLFIVAAITERVQAEMNPNQRRSGNSGTPSRPENMGAFPNGTRKK